MKQKILKKHIESSFLDENGYVVLDLLDESQINSFLDYYAAYNQYIDLANGFHITMEHAKSDVRQKTAQYLVENFNGILEGSFKNFNLFQGSFILKQKNSDSNSVPAHQDWSFVDESLGHKSYTLWVALTDVKKENGAIELIPKSHELLNQIRYTPNEKYEDHKNVEALSEKSKYTSVELKAGQAILWDHRLIHKSLPNLSNKDRLSVVLGVKEQNAQLNLYWKNPETKEIMKIKVGDDFYHRNNSETLYNFYLNNKTPF